MQTDTLTPAGHDPALSALADAHLGGLAALAQQADDRTAALLLNDAASYLMSLVFRRLWGGPLAEYGGDVLLALSRLRCAADVQAEEAVHAPH